MMQWLLIIDSWQFPIAALDFKKRSLIAAYTPIVEVDIPIVEEEPYSVSIFEDTGDTNWALSPEWIISHPPDRGDEENDRQREYQDEGILREQDDPRDDDYYYDIGEYWFANQ